MSDELQIIERIRKAVPSRAPFLRVGIGDDAALLSPPKGTEIVITTDSFLEDVHFLADLHPADSVGYKALARAASDLAAVAASPLCFFLTLALPLPRTGAWLDAFLRGLAHAARELKLPIAGGDVSRQQKTAMAITVVGNVSPGRAILRSTARPGELLYVTGELGGAEIGLHILERGPSSNIGSHRFLQKHLYPKARIKFAQWLSANGLATSMIDLSDGLSSDLNRLCQASGVGAELREARIPRPSIPAPLRKLRMDPLQAALHGGDDYELLFTVPVKQAARIPRSYRGVKITLIGKTTTQNESIRVIRADGSAYPLRPLGWDPFRSG
jgi:thiamine-monophosphate kinase